MFRVYLTSQTVPKSKEETDDEDARMDGEKEEDIFELDDSDDAFAAIGRGRGAKKQTKKKTQTKTKAVGKVIMTMHSSSGAR